MGGEVWSLTAKICDSCKTAPSKVFCRADAAFLCVACDGKIHVANSLGSRHARVLVCEICEQAPAAVTCKADAAALCAACDRDIHSANPLALRHERLPVAPFYETTAVAGHSAEEEEEAAFWLLLPNANDKPDEDEESRSLEYKSAHDLFSDVDRFLDLVSGDPKPVQDAGSRQYFADGVVPVQSKTEFGSCHYPGPVADGLSTYEMDYCGLKPLMYNFTEQSLSDSVSFSSLEVGVVPEHTAMADASDISAKSEAAPVPVSGPDREARVSRYREKRKNRKFDKTIRYASRKAYAETRPRIKGRFAKRAELEFESAASSYGVVPIC